MTSGREEKDSVALVTGSSGYFGGLLVLELAKRFKMVKCFDLSRPNANLPPNCEVLQGNILDSHSVSSALAGCDVVFHTASAGMLGSQQLNESLCKSVNVEGTKCIISECIKNSVSRLVYTSSYNVVFSNRPLINCTEKEPYPDDSEQYDWYSKTKKAAEIAVISANATNLPKGGKLVTCALRPNAIYGTNEQKHLPRTVSKIQQGVTFIKFGYGVTLMDWCHVDNLVQAHVKAALKLCPSEKSIVAGQVYNISDGKPVEPYTFFKPIFDVMKTPLPWLTMPYQFIFVISWIGELLHTWLRPVIHIEPVITRVECAKICNSHYCSMEKARRDLGYDPKEYSYATMKDAVDVLMKNELTTNSPIVSKSVLLTCIAIIIFCVIVSYWFI